MSVHIGCLYALQQFNNRQIQLCGAWFKLRIFMFGRPTSAACSCNSRSIAFIFGDDDSYSFMSAQWVFSGGSSGLESGFVCRFAPPTTENVFLKKTYIYVQMNLILIFTSKKYSFHVIHWKKKKLKNIGCEMISCMSGLCTTLFFWKVSHVHHR